MIAPQSPSNSTPTAPENPNPPLVQYSASGRPNTRAERITFQLWIIMFLMVILFTLINYLAMQGIFTRIINLFKGLLEGIGL